MNLEGVQYIDKLRLQKQAVLLTLLITTNLMVRLMVTRIDWRVVIGIITALSFFVSCKIFEGCDLKINIKPKLDTLFG